MSLHLRRILRRAPVESLRAYLRSVSPQSFDEVDWSATRTELVDKLNEAIGNLGDLAQDRVYSDCDRVGQFVDEHGRRLLRGVLPEDQDGLAQFDELEDVTACSLFVLMHGDETFEKALSALYLQRLLNGRDWTGLDFVPDVKPRMLDAPSLDAFEARLRDIFASAGPVPRLHLDRFTRHDPDLAGDGVLDREQITIYIEATPETALAFSEQAQLVTNVVRPVREAALLFDATEGTLDVVAKGGGPDRRHDIAAAFVETMLAAGASLAGRARRTLALDILKTRPDLDILPEDHVQSVEVTRLVLGAPDSRSIVTIEVPGRHEEAARSDIYARAEGAFGRNGLPNRSGWRVRAAKLRIRFEPEAKKRRAKSVTFELKAPDKTNLRDQMERHRQIADVLLARWKLYEGAE
ncbi:hypothetical protein [Thalassobaculum sp.]|uniref:hypothetical protein n=1 Tax=Thalassobaculum sp. TaxID=2022740 RepID=UPI0032EEC108